MFILYLSVRVFPVKNKMQLRLIAHISNLRKINYKDNALVPEPSIINPENSYLRLTIKEIQTRQGMEMYS